jgi:hypothetical protein
LRRANGEGEYCAVLLLKADDEFARPGSDAAGLRALLDETLPQFSPLISDGTVAAVAAKPASNLPAFRYVGPVLHQGSSTVLLGDAIHTVKPYFGLGGAMHAAHTSHGAVAVRPHISPQCSDATPPTIPAARHDASIPLPPHVLMMW